MQHHHTALRTRAIAVGHLRAFMAVTRHLNFRAAAEELALTQSAVTRQIQALETEIGVPLFLRHTRAVELTSAGTQLVRAVSPSLVATTLPRLGLQESFSAAIIHKTELSGYELPLTI